MAASLPPPPLTTQLARDDDTTSPEWARWFQQLGALVAKLQVPPGWTAPALLNSWTNLGAPWAVVGYRKDILGQVWVKGCAVSPAGGSSSAIFTLPTGYRPAESRQFIEQNASSGQTFGNVSVDSGGNVVPLATVAAGAHLSLEFSFYAEQ